MHEPIVHRRWRCAVQHRMASGACRRALGALLSAALFGVASLGAAPALHEFDLRIVKRHVEGNATTIRVARGDAVVLHWRTDEPVRLHMHGYDIRADLSPAVPASMRFEARVAGRFAISAHGFGAAAAQGAPPGRDREKALLYVEVLPE
jgi:hypothetical protein